MNGKKTSIRYLSKKDSKQTFGQSSMTEMIPPELTQQNSLRKRDSKRQQKVENESNAKLLEIYNDMKAIQEGKELPNRQVYLRRIGLNLVKQKHDLYKFPILQYVEETCKIMLMNEFEMLYWYHLMKTYLKHLKEGAKFSIESVRLFFFQSSMFVKKFLFLQQQSLEVDTRKTQMFSKQIDSIEAYIKTYHYSNFDVVYKQFDREDMILLDPEFKQSGMDQIKKEMGSYYESFSYLTRIDLKKLQKLFNSLKQPFETDNKKNIIDYNWHVDGILKNSQSYNKENAEKNENKTAKKISLEDQIPVQKQPILKSNLSSTQNQNQILGKRQQSKNERNDSLLVHGNSLFYPTPSLLAQDSLLADPINMYQNLVNFQQNHIGNETYRGSPNFAALQQPSLNQKDSLFNQDARDMFMSDFKNFGLTPLVRNSSILSSRSQNNEDDQGRMYGNSLSSLVKPVSKKPNYMNQMNTIQYTSSELQQRLSSNQIASLINESNHDKSLLNLKMSEQDIKTLQQKLTSIQSDLKFDHDDLQSPLLALDRSQSASQFLIGPGNQLNLNKNSSFLGSSFFGGINNFQMNRESSAFQSAFRAKDEKQSDQSSGQSPPDLNLDKNRSSNSLKRQIPSPETKRESTRGNNNKKK